ncbi:peroxide stress protein YaaA [Palleronia sp.]|uniref:peroxide stress protein YaaA n=1 Tax=Palleronia sp. TaxID=1940284 RepID=UPI0035C79A5A
MLVVISPAKKLDWAETRPEVTPPRMQDQANLLAARARELSVNDLKRLMRLSDKLAVLNYGRFAALEEDPTPENSRPAAETFAGDTYQGLDWASLDEDAQRFGDGHLRILSGLYGVLRPRDAIQPYRLEMGTRLETERGRSLYEFWGDRIARALAEDAAAVGAQAVLNCASQEYFGAVDTEALGLRIVTPRFLDEKNGEAKVISFHAKRARGAMARFVCEHRIDSVDGLRAFDAGGYAYAPELSQPDAPAFFRGAEAAAKAA